MNLIPEEKSYQREKVLRGLNALKMSGRPKKIYPLPEKYELEFEFAANTKLGLAANSLYIADYKGHTVFKQVLRMRNGKTFILFYWEHGKDLYRKQDDVIYDIQAHCKEKEDWLLKRKNK